MRPRRKSRVSIFDVLIALVMLVGVGLLCYPTVSNYWNQYTQSRVIAGYAHAVDSMEARDYTAILQAAAGYNTRLLKDPDRFSPDEADTAAYNDLLNITGDGIMAYIEIPKISVKLPVYHGVSEAVLQVAAGHIEGSSLPIGGAGTHIAISGHRGLTSATLFTHLNDLEIGDKFYIRILNQTMAYQIDQIDTVLPEEFDLLRIDPDEDYCTLITCTPYGVNSHRLLVRGTRVPYVEAEKAEAEAASPVMPETRTNWVLFFVGVGCVFVLIYMFKPKAKKKARPRGESRERPAGSRPATRTEDGTSSSETKTERSATDGAPEDST